MYSKLIDDTHEKIIYEGLICFDRDKEKLKNYLNKVNRRFNFKSPIDHMKTYEGSLDVLEELRYLDGRGNKFLCRRG